MEKEAGTNQTAYNEQNHDDRTISEGSTRLSGNERMPFQLAAGIFSNLKSLR
jgi:hypothetical protein